MNKKKTRKTLLIIAVVLFVILLLLRNFIIKENKQYNSLEDLETPEDVIIYMGGKYIKEKESADENFKLDIYANLKVDLYTGDTSNEPYYEELIGTMAYVLEFDNFRIIDEEKENLIAVVCNKEIDMVSDFYINGYYNYYEREESIRELNKMNETEITELNIESPELISLVKNNWNKSSLGIDYEKEFNNYLYSNNGIAVRNVYKKVYNIVFRNNYSGNVLNGINTQMSIEEVIEILGQPTFGNLEDGLIGYKGTEIYAFFYYNQISIYRVENYETDDFINAIKEFKEREDIKKYISSITDMWPDYDLYSYDTGYVNLSYVLKGIKIQFNITNKHGVIIGNNYNGNISELTKLKEEFGIEEIYFENEDFVYEAEKTRVNSVKG